MPAHAVTEDTHSLRIHLFETVENGLWQFRRDVAVHFISLVPRGFRSVDVETRAASEVVGVVFALDFETACDILMLLVIGGFQDEW